MDFKNKIKNLNSVIAKFFESIKKFTLDDFWKAYRRFLKRIPDVLHLKNVVLFGSIASLTIFILFGQRFSALSEYFPKKPVPGGIYTEGIVGNIQQLNPLFSPSNSVENTATTLIFSGLTKKNNKRENIPDLAKSWTVSKDGKTYTFALKDSLLWQDGEKLTADDVIFTIETIQDPDVKSPLLSVWKGVKVAKVNDNTIDFVLKTPYSDFVSKTDFAVLPKHLLSSIPSRSLVSAEFNTNPVGSGPYIFEEIKNIKESQELVLIPNQYYYGQEPYISKVVLKTYSNQSDMISAYSRREVLGIEKTDPSILNQKGALPNIQAYNLSVPEYDLIYFNLRSEIFKEKALREAISLSISRDDIVNSVYHGSAIPIYTPIVSGYAGSNPKLKTKQDVRLAKEKISALGYTLDKENYFTKNNKRLSVRLVISRDLENSQIARSVKKNLQEIGVEVQIEEYKFESFVQDHLRPRDFDLILLSQNLGSGSDLYAFWHSSGANDPGLNLSGLNDRKLDKFLEQGRTMSSLESGAKNEKYKDIIQTIAENQAAIYLAWPNYIYGVSKEVKGPRSGLYVEPRNRFWNIENWYIYDKKVKTL